MGVANPFDRFGYRPFRLRPSCGSRGCAWHSDRRARVVGVAGRSVLEERSHRFRELDAVRVRDVMITKRINVHGWRKIAPLKEQFFESREPSFFVAIQDAYESGVASLEQIQRVSDREADCLPVGQVTRPISYVDSIRDNDSLLNAFNNMERSKWDHFLVLNSDEQIVGIVTRAHLSAEMGSRMCDPATDCSSDSSGLRSQAA